MFEDDLLDSYCPNCREPHSDHTAEEAEECRAEVEGGCRLCRAECGDEDFCTEEHARRYAVLHDLPYISEGDTTYQQIMREM